MRVVLDASVVVSGVCLRGEAWSCLVKFARRRAFAYGTETTLAETRETVTRLIREKNPRNHAANILNSYLETVKMIDPAPLGKQRSRDPKDVRIWPPHWPRMPISLSVMTRIYWRWKSHSAWRSSARRSF